MRGVDADRPTKGMPPPSLPRRERLGLVLGTACLGLAFALAPSTAYYGDSLVNVERLRRGWLAAPHPGVFPPAALIVAVTGASPELGLRLLNGAGGALLVSGTYLALRRLGFTLRPSLFAGALLALAPGSLFFGRQMEVRSPHAGAIAVAFAAVCGFAMGRGSGKGAGIALGSVLVTHATGALSVSFLLACGRRLGAGPRGFRFRAVLLPALAFASAFVLGTSLLQYALSPSPRRLPTSVEAAIRGFFWAVGRGNSPGGPLSHVWDALLRPAGLLALLGTAGLGCALFQRKPWALPLFLWLAVYLGLATAWAYVEEGGYLLAVYPALAVGAASLAQGGDRPEVRRSSRSLRRSLPAAALALQAGWGVREGLLPSLGPSPVNWVEAARQEMGETGCLVTGDGVHFSMVQRHTRIDLATPTWYYAEQGEALLREFARKTLAESRKRPVWIDRDGPPEEPAQAKWEAFLGMLREGAALEPVAREPFRAWRVVPRP